MPDLEQRLRELGPELAFPPTPSLAQTLELPLEPAPRRPQRRTLRAFAIACVLLVLAVGTAFAVPASRHAILDWLGLSGVTVERVVSLPTVPEVADLALGDPVSLEQAQRAVDFDVVVPQTLGDPDETYVDQTTPGGRVTFVYRDEAGGIAALVTQFQGDVHPDLVGKLVAAGTQVETVTVTGGAPGIFLSGGPHVVFYRDPGGEIRDETLRLAGNTLLWERGELLVRLESALQLEDALRVARSTQPLASR